MSGTVYATGEGEQPISLAMNDTWTYTLYRRVGERIEDGTTWIVVATRKGASAVRCMLDAATKGHLMMDLRATYNAKFLTARPRLLPPEDEVLCETSNTRIWVLSFDPLNELANPDLKLHGPGFQ